MCRDGNHPDDASCPAMDLAAHLHCANWALLALREIQSQWATLRKSVNEIRTYAGMVLASNDIGWADSADRFAEIARRGVEAINEVEKIVYKQSWLAKPVCARTRDLRRFVTGFARTIGGSGGRRPGRPKSAGRPVARRSAASTLRALLGELSVVRPTTGDKDRLGRIATELGEKLQELLAFDGQLERRIVAFDNGPIQVQTTMGSCSGTSRPVLRSQLRSAVSRLITESNLWDPNYLKDTLAWRKNEEEATAKV